jgi:hypothetical protein
VAGNQSAAALSTAFKYDATKPTLAPSVSPTPVLLNGTATASAGAADATSGVDAAGTGCDAVATAPVGSHTVNCHATDVAGNTNSATLTYVVTYRFDGYLQPINDTAHTGLLESKFKLGQTIPAKFVIKDANGVVVQQVGNPAFSKTYLGASCGQAVSDTTDPATPDAGSVFTWDGSQYHYNWSTKGLPGGEYRITATLADAEKLSVSICLS